MVDPRGREVLHKLIGVCLATCSGHNLVVVVGSVVRCNQPVGEPGPEDQLAIPGLEPAQIRIDRINLAGTQNLLESVRIESGQVSLRHVEVDVEEIVEEAVAMTRPLLSRRGQELEIDLPYPAPPLVGDPPRLTQVLVNLIANASKYGPEGTSVRLGVRAAGPMLEFAVDDQGPGFPGSMSQPDKFHRGASPRADDDASAEPRQEGSGLGLWICRSILERHGGGLRIERRTDLTGPARTRVVAVVPSADRISTP